MNYIAALILIGIGMKEEETAFTIFRTILQAPEKHNSNYRIEQLYDPSLQGLFILSDHVTNWIARNHPKLKQHLSSN